MKNVRPLIISSISFLLIGGAFALGIHGFQTIDTKGDPAAAGLTITPESIVEGNVATRYGNEVTIRGEYSKSSTIDLGENGYIGNFNAIRGMHSLNVTFDGAGSLECWVGYKRGILYQVSSSISSGASVSLPSDPEARFFKLQASGGTVNISSINVDISCPGLEGEATERLTNYVFSEGVISNSINNGSALSVFSEDDGISSIDLSGKSKGSIRTVSIEGDISFTNSFQSTSNLYFVDLSEWDAGSDVYNVANTFSSSTNLRKLFLPSGINSMNGNPFSGTATGIESIFIDDTYKGVNFAVNSSGVTSGTNANRIARVRYFFPGSGELADGINYWVYNALNEPVPYNG